MTVKVTTTCDLMEPYTYQWFYKGTPTEASEVSPWMQCQVDAGIMKIEGQERIAAKRKSVEETTNG